jgi:cytochrome c oxidase cbb3-type subunit 1
MAGFVTSLLIFVMVQVLGEDGWIFNGTRSFYAWQGAVLAYILLMTFAGWREGLDPAFAIVPGTTRNAVYLLRLLCGIIMLLASGDWLLAASRLLRQSPFPQSSRPQEQMP